MNVRIGITMLLVCGLGIWVLKRTSHPNHDSQVVRAKLDNTQGLPIGAPVSIAGLAMGQVIDRRIGRGYSEIDIHLPSSVDLRDDATLYKKRLSFLSGPSLEIDPGTSSTQLRGQYIKRIDEVYPIEDVLNTISQTFPKLHELSDTTQQRTNALRQTINSPVSGAIAALDQSTLGIHKQWRHYTEKINDTLSATETWEFDASATIDSKIEQLSKFAFLARNKLSNARSSIAPAAQNIRTRIENAATQLQHDAKPVRDADDGQGPWGPLINTPERHDEIADITSTTRNFFRRVAGWRTQVGLAAEYSTISGQTRGYLTVKAGQSDRYYYLEIVKTNQGGRPKISVVHDGTSNTWQREVTIRNDYQFTVQWAKRLGPITMRGGLKQSSFGAGTDLHLLRDRLEISADVFAIGQNDRPHVKVAASYRVFANLYIMGGIDDALNPRRQYDVVGTGEQARTFDEIFVGKDYYIGSSLRFDDRDLSMLMLLGTQTLAKALKFNANS